MKKCAVCLKPLSPEDTYPVKPIGDLCGDCFNCWYLWTKARMSDYEEMFLRLRLKRGG